MAVTTTYSINFVKYLPLELGTSAAPEVISLANGGFAFAGEHNAGGWHVDGELFNSAGQHGNDWTSTSDSFNPSLAQLSNGNIVQFSEDGAGGIFFEIRSASGALVKAATDSGLTDTYAPDVAAVGSGFWTASETYIAGSNYDIYIDRWSSNGTYLGFKAVDTSSARDTGASIAALSNGNVAVTWTRTFSDGDTGIGCAIYDSAGNVVKASFALDDIGAVNENVSICALVGGGFAVAYEDSGWATGTIDITVGIYSNTGALVREENISSPSGNDDGSDDANPYITQLANGQLVVAYSDNFYTDTDTLVVLLNQNLDVLAETSVSTLDIKNDAETPTIAGYGSGLLAVFESSDNENAGEALQVQRRSIGDSANNVITGDFLSDFMNGAAGNDRLSGGAGADDLRGAAGADVVNGGNGADKLNGGLGHDTLTGGGGGDKFIFNSAVGNSHSDVITDFTHGSDKIQLDNSVFTALGAAGTLAAGAFRVGANAGDTNDRMIYNSATGDLFYDADGTGGGAKILIATLDAGLGVTHADFAVI
ncbi:MAG: calcium-binding protein [Hyphomonadaceae bacterium]|nr:calcium-binding protein [Hyphomonadaceae bacterium]